MASTAVAAVTEATASALVTAPQRVWRPGGPISILTGVVVSAGLATKTVKVRVGGEEWNKKVRKYFKKPQTKLVHDPKNSLRTGDVVEIMNGRRVSKMKRFIVNRIVAPFGPPIEERPPVPTLEEREAEHEMLRAAKLSRRKLRNETALMGKKVEKAQRTTEEITKLAWKMRLVDRVDWKAPSSS